VGVAKPDPAIYRLAAERVGLPPEACLFVDDYEPNVAAAREVGMAAVFFRIDRGHDLGAMLGDLGVHRRGRVYLSSETSPRSRPARLPPPEDDVRITWSICPPDGHLAGSIAFATVIATIALRL
jgi:putative hydrolase of the HAD superfamily